VAAGDIVPAVADDGRLASGLVLESQGSQRQVQGGERIVLENRGVQFRVRPDQDVCRRHGRAGCGCQAGVIDVDNLLEPGLRANVGVESLVEPVRLDVAACRHRLGLAGTRGEQQEPAGREDATWTDVRGQMHAGLLEFWLHRGGI
jgi:hypothetical protein